jgi:hypothetical protein
LVPTTQPRYAVTDTGDVSEMLDVATRAWPDVRDRKELLLRLARTGYEAVSERLAREDAAARRERQCAAARRVRELVDVDVLMSDEAWR